MEAVDSIQDERFGGALRLHGPEGFARLQSAHVAIVGIGGVGSWTAEALARAGVGHITLIDGDDICVSNVNRQVHALNSTVGQMEVDVMAERLLAINPKLSVRAEPLFLTETTSERLDLPSFDGVVDAIDRIKWKCWLLDWCRTHNLPVVTTGGAGGRMDPSQVQVADLARSYHDPLLAKVRKELRQKHGFPRNTKKLLGISAVFSPEPIRWPKNEITGDCKVPEAGEHLRLDCATGYGTAGFVTGTFGFLSAGRMIQLLTEEPVS